MRKYFREKQVHKYTLATLSFIWWNFAVCLLPIVASYFFRSTNNTILLSSFLAYSFTLLAVTVYSFIHIRRRKESTSLIVTNAKILLTVGVMIIYIILYFIFNYDDGINRILSSNIVETSVASFVLVFCIILVLTVPLIKEQVLADTPEEVMRTIKQSEAEGDRTRNEINEEGI